MSQFHFAIEVETQIESEVLKRAEIEDYLVAAKTKSEAEKVLKTELKSFYPQRYFNLKWQKIELRVRKVIFNGAKVGVLVKKTWIFN